METIQKNGKLWFDVENERYTTYNGKETNEH